MSLLLLFGGVASTPTGTVSIIALSEPLTHACEVTLASGEVLRWAPDERDVRHVPIAQESDTEMPGGYGPAHVVLPRPDWVDAGDAKLFAATRFYFAETDQTFHEGRVTGLPQVGPSQIQIELEGLSKHLEDNKTARFLGISRDMSRWQGMSVARQISLLSATSSIADAASASDPSTGAPALVCTAQSPWTNAIRVEGWFYANGLNIGLLDYALKPGPTVSVSDPNWYVRPILSTDDSATSSDDPGNVLAAGPVSGTLTATAARKYVAAILRYIGAKTDSNSYPVYWTLLAPVGDHGLPLQGTVSAPNNGRGLLVSDVVAYLLSRFAPLVNFTTGIGGSVPPTSFAVPHCAYLDETTVAAMLGDLILYGGATDLPLDWGVYDNREFFLKAPGSYGTTWRARRDQATEPTSQGPDSATRLNGVLVTYDDGTGRKLSVGPPGSGADLEDSRLQDTSVENPANQDGADHWEAFDASITTQDGAVIVGQLVLAAANQQAWRGDITLKDVVADSAGAEQPVALVKSGDRVVIEDDADTSERRIVNTSYTASSSARTLTASVGAPPDLLDVLLARTGIVTKATIGG